MDHVDPAHLVELALGHAAGDEDAGALRHIASCPRCREELRRTRRVVTSARGAGGSDLPAAPPEHVWQRIVEELPRGAVAPARTGGRPDRSGRAVPEARTSGAGRRAGFLALTLLAGAVRAAGRLRARAGRRRGRLRPPRWRRSR